MINQKIKPGEGGQAVAISPHGSHRHDRDSYSSCTTVCTHSWKSLGINLFLPQLHSASAPLSLIPSTDSCLALLFCSFPHRLHIALRFPQTIHTHLQLFHLSLSRFPHILKAAVSANYLQMLAPSPTHIHSLPSLHEILFFPLNFFISSSLPTPILPSCNCSRVTAGKILAKYKGLADALCF